MTNRLFFAPVWAVIASVFLGGCAGINDAGTASPPSVGVPEAMSFTPSPQLRLQATQHWATIADETGGAIVALLNKGGVCVPETKTCAAIFVNPPVVITEFSRVFYTQLITTLVKAGLHVNKEPTGSVLIDIDVNPVVFTKDRPQYEHAGLAGDLGRGIVGLREVSPAADSSRNARPGGGAMDWFKNKIFAGGTPQAEIVVTVSASDKMRYLARETNVYYIVEGDTRFYNQEICSTFLLCARPAPAAVVAATAAGAMPAPVTEVKPLCPECQPKPRREFKVEGDCPLNSAHCPVETSGVETKPVKPTAKTKK